MSTASIIFQISHFRQMCPGVFLQQEPGDNGTEILNGLKYVRPGNGFEPNFEMTEKIDVNGPNEHPLYTYLKVNNTTGTSGLMELN